MVGRCVCILMVLSLANGNTALAGAQGVTQSVPEIAALEPELEGYIETCTSTQSSLFMRSELLRFSAYGRAGVRAVLLHIGAVNPAELASGAKLPDLHSSKWIPELEPTLRSLVAAEVVMLTELLVARNQ